jgi:hypothetical protein
MSQLCRLRALLFVMLSMLLQAGAVRRKAAKTRA